MYMYTRAKPLHIYLGLILEGLSSLSTTEVSMTLFLNQCLICGYDVQKTCLCLVQIVCSPLQTLHLVCLVYYLAVSAPSHHPSQ